MARGKVKLQLTSDSALVLFECWSVKRRGFGASAGCAPRQLGALSVLAGALQTKLVEPFEADYDEMVAAARERLADQYGFRRPD